MYAGHVVELGPTEQVFGLPVHPYTPGIVGRGPVTQAGRGADGDRGPTTSSGPKAEGLRFCTQVFVRPS